MVKKTERINYMEEVDYDPFAGFELESVVPCTEPQIEIMTSCLLGGNDANLAFNESITLKFSGVFNKAAMDHAFQKLIIRHESLRAAFSIQNKQLCIFKNLAFEIDYRDISTEAEDNKQMLLNEYIQQDALHIFDLVKGPLFKAGLIKTGETLHHLVITAHHIVCDGWSLGIMLQDLGILYSAYVQNKLIELSTPVLFSKFSKEYVAFLQTPEYEAIEKFWLDQYSGPIPVVNLPVDSTRPMVRTYKSNRLDFDLDITLIAALKNIGTQFGCSLVTTLLAAFEAFLYRLTGDENIVIGLPTAGQSATGNFHLVGHCVNLLPLKSKPVAGIPFSDYLKIRKSATFDAYEHQQLTFGSLLKKLRIPRDPSRIPLVPVVFNIDMGLDYGVHFYGLSHKLTSNPRAYENFELFLNVSGSENDVTLEWSYNSYLFKAETIASMMADFKHLLETIISNPSIPLGEIKLIKKSAIVYTLKEINQTDAIYPLNSSLHELIAQVTKRLPGKTALIFENRQISYLQLDEMSNMLSHYITEQNIGIGDFVGVALNRSPEMLVVLLAIMKAGAAYIPLDPEYPVDRIEFILKDASAKMLITSKQYEGKFTNPTGNVFIEDALLASAAYPATAPAVKVVAQDLLYVLYTSGSTGKPKGVLIEHRSLVNLLYSMIPWPGFSEEDILLAVTTIAFDIAGLELFLPLITGGTIVLANSEAIKDGAKLLELVEKEKVTIMQATPSTYKMMLNSGWEHRANMKVLCCGEPMSKELANKLVPRCASLWNMYGPTETTIYSTGKRILETDEIITIGKPINNTQVYIVDEQFNMVPEGTIGEICICGDGLARGYLNRPDLTSEKFIPHPFHASKKMYRTGDLGKFLKQGEILCLGRIDNQVKIRGYRIEIGEIENTLEAMGDIKEAVVVCHENKLNDQRLVAYVVPELNGKSVSLTTFAKEQVSNWKKQAGLKLPAYMVPAHIEVLNALPLTPNGKIDRKALPEPNFGSAEAAPADGEFTAKQKLIYDIWSELLAIENIGLTDNFFEVGGHSLIAIEVMMRIEKETGKRLPPSTLFQYSTIAGLASVLDDQADISHWKSLVPIKPSGDKDPLYIIHGAGLDVMVFNNIARYVDTNQPVYGVKAKGKDGDDEALDVIEEMAAFYISEIIQQNPDGPYALVGFSAGSVIAFEMAKQLMAMNRKVKIVGIIDYDLEQPEVNTFFNKKMKKNTIEFFPRLMYVLNSLVRHPKKAIKFQLMCLRLRYVSLASRFGVSNNTKLEGLYLHIENAKQKHEEALRNYVVKPLDISIDLFSTKIKVYYLKDTQFLGWKPYALKGIKVHKVPGDHDDMLLPPNDKEFANVLQQALDKL